MTEIDLDDEFDDEFDGADWYCNHDVPNGCPECARSRNMQAALDTMTDAERQEWMYGPGGTFESYFAPGGPAWQADEAERRGQRCENGVPADQEAIWR